MSILKDLDPQYAKLHSEPSLRKPVIWIGIVLLTMGCGYWVVAQTLTTATPSDAPSTAMQNGSSTTSAAIPTRHAPLPESEKPNVAPKPGATPTDAAIREVQPRTATSDQQPAQLIQSTSQENATHSLADAEYRRPPPSAPDRLHAPAATNPRPAAKAEDAKRKSPSSQSAARNDSMSGKKGSERDIDIITAIVR